MKLTKITITAYKGICEAKEIHFNDFNVIVGQNDVGKSTILKAIDIFLNNTSPSKDDLNNKTENTEISIIAEFDPRNKSVIIDENIGTTFEDEELVNADKKLVLKKTWDTTKSKITAEAFILRKKYSENDFLAQTETQLIATCKKLGIETKKANGDEYNNKEKRQKIRDYNLKNSISYNYEFEKLPTSGSNRFKIINDELKTLLPCFEYFKADTSLLETDTSIQKFFKTIAIKTIEEEIDTSDVESKITDKLSRILEKFSSKVNQVVSSDSKVSPSVEFDWSKLISTTFKSAKDGAEIPLNCRGDGFRRITMMAYFEYLAEQEADEHQRIIFGFEEPETFLHPSGQENLFAKLSDLCLNNYQVVISTHSPIIVANTKKNDLIHIHKNNGSYNVEQNLEDIRNIAIDLGIRVDNQFISLFDRAKVLLLVEGIDDANAFNHICTLYKQNQYIDKTFEELEIAIVPIGGCDSIKHWVSLNLLITLGKPFLIIQDSDKTSLTDESPTKKNLEDLNFTVNKDFFITKKRNLENYIPAAALNRIVPGAAINYGDFDNVKKICGSHPLAGELGGKGVASRHFDKLTIIEIRSTFFDGTEDEFLRIYTKLLELLN